MKTLVTGGTGFTGAALVLRLLEEGHEVRVIDVEPGIRLKELERAGADIRLGDIRDRQLVDDSMRGCDAVFHVAAAFREIHIADREYFDVNVEAMRHLCESSLREGVERFVYCSTCGVHGAIEEPPAGEDAPIRPNDYYQETKWLGEEVLNEYLRRGLRGTTLRPLGIYGPGDPGRLLMLFRIARSGRFPMFGNGKTLFHTVYIDNMVDAFLLAMTEERAIGETYLIGDERWISLEELVSAVGDALGRTVKIHTLPLAPLYAAAAVVEAVCRPFRIPPPLFRRRVDWYSLDRAFSIEKAKRELGFRPRIGLAEGLRRTAAWYRANGYLA